MIREKMNQNLYLKQEALEGPDKIIKAAIQK